MAKKKSKQRTEQQTCIARIALIIEVMHLITKAPTTRAYINMAAQFIARRLKPDERRALDQGFGSDTTIRVMKIASLLIHDEPVADRDSAMPGSSRPATANGLSVD